MEKLLILEDAPLVITLAEDSNHMQRGRPYILSLGRDLCAGENYSCCHLSNFINKPKTIKK